MAKYLIEKSKNISVYRHNASEFQISIWDKEGQMIYLNREDFIILLKASIMILTEDMGE